MIKRFAKTNVVIASYNLYNEEFGVFAITTTVSKNNKINVTYQEF